MSSARALDLVVWGATGFTGRLVCEHLSKNHTPAVRWAMAGRNKAKLEALKAQLTAAAPAAAAVPVHVCNPADNEQLDALLSSSKVVLAMAGPYALYGAPVVASAVRCGTHYADITGEAAFSRATIDQHDAAARQGKTMIVNSCGYDSVPFDLGTLLCLQALGPPPAAADEATTTTRVLGFVGASAGGFSGGTLASAVNALKGGALTGGGVHSLDPGWAPRPSRQPRGVPAYSPEAGCWTVLSVMASVNERVVLRSAALRPDLYGPRGGFDYEEATLVPRGGRAAAAAATAVLALLGAVVATPPLRWLALRLGLLPSPGQGPSRAAREGGYFAAHFVATRTTAPAAAAAAAAPVSVRRAAALVAKTGADPGYKATAIMATEAALCMALQPGDCPGAAAGGCLTPATALGDALVGRLRAQGFKIEARVLAAGEKGLIGV